VPAVVEPSDEVKEDAKPRKGWFFNPYLHVFLSLLMQTTAQLCLKLGADKSVGGIWLGVEALRSGWVWIGILAMVTGLLSWLYGLRYVPLNIAFNLSGLVQVMLPLSCWWLLGEKIGPIRWCGIALVCAGVCVIARPLMQVEEKL